MSNFTVKQDTKFSVIQSTENAGEKLDSLLSPDLKSTLVSSITAEFPNLVLDLSQFRYCDSSGLSAILVGNRRCNELGGSIVLCGIQPMVLKLMEISQLTGILNTVPTLSEATDFIKMEIVERDLGSE